jgi:hypothetical protein
MKKRLNTWRRTDRIFKNQKKLSVCLILILFLLSLSFFQSTYGRFFRMYTSGDATIAIKFGIEITPIEFFADKDNETTPHIRFIYDTDVWTSSFQVKNSGETVVVCTPQINVDISYKVLVSEEEKINFIINPGETVVFQILVYIEEWTNVPQEASICIDIQQAEGGTAR